jgi:hypothetical protein
VLFSSEDTDAIVRAVSQPIVKSEAFSPKSTLTSLKSSEMGVTLCTYPDFLLMLFGLKFIEPTLPSLASGLMSRHEFS